MGGKNSEVWGCLIQLAVLCGIAGLIIILLGTLLIGA